MKLLKPVLLACAVLFLLGCGGAGDENIEYKKGETKPLAELQSTTVTEPGIRITDVKFGDAVDVLNDLIAEPVLSDTEADMEFSYRWFVNDNEVPGENGNTLPREYFKEGDWVHCRVAENAPESTVPEFLSDRVKIAGPVPQLDLAPVGEFSPPGIFTYRIIASMPDIDDLDPDFGDEGDTAPDKALKFELVSPLGKGILLNSRTGEITWNITQQLIDELGPSIEIKFNVVSPEGRKVSSSITLNLEEGEQDTDDNSGLGTEIE